MRGCSGCRPPAVHTALDVVTPTMAGAHVTLMVSALLLRGPAPWTICVRGCDNEWSSLSEMRGNMSLRKVAEPEACERQLHAHVAGLACVTALQPRTISA
jgi:hypothetical protein